MFLLPSAAAFAEPLWVDADQVEAVRAAVEVLWPDAPLEVESRPDQLQGEGWLWVGGLLVWVHDGRAWTERADDPATAVLLARSWYRTPPVGEVEVPPAPPPVQAPPIPEPVPPPPPAWWVSLGVQGSTGFDGVRLGASRLARHLELGASSFVSTRPPVDADGLEESLNDLQAVTALEARDVLSFGVQGLWHPVLAPPSSTARVGPVALLGLQVGQQVVRELTPAGITLEPTSTVGVGVSAGVGADLWLSRRWSVLLTAQDRFDLLHGLAQRVVLGADVRVGVW